MLKLPNAVFGQEVFLSTKYGFRKLWDLHKSKMVEVHTYFSTCNFFTKPHGLNEELSRICSRLLPLTELLEKGSFYILMDLKIHLQQPLKKVGNTVGHNLQKLASTSSDQFQNLTGDVLYKKVRNEINMRLSDLILTLNTNGSPVFKSSKGSVWPI